MASESPTVRQLLGTDITAIQKLASEDREALYSMIENARLRRQTLLDVAISEAMDVIPRPLRSTVRSILFGRGVPT